MKRTIFLISMLCAVLALEAQNPSRSKTDGSGAALTVRRERAVSGKKESKPDKDKAATEAEKNKTERDKSVRQKEDASAAKENAAADAAPAATSADAQDGDTMKRPRFLPRRAAVQQEAKPQDDRAQLYFPTASDMPDGVVWRRDIYRALDLTKDENATLYYPLEQQGDQINLFTYLFKLILRGEIKAYDYTLNGSENFGTANQVKAKDLMDRYHIYYESKDGRMRVSDTDLPAAEVLEYFIKESAYYDQHTASYHTKVTALCPVLKRAGEFGGETASYPMFWVKYSDISPFLAKLPLTGSNYNNAAGMSADDYFAMNCYDGKIYKTNNLQGKALANYCPTDSAMSREQARIEKQLADFEKNIWGEDSTARAAKDSASLAADAGGGKVKQKKRGLFSSRRKSSGSSAENKQSSGKGSSSSPARVSVRRERH